jgi:L-glyceraldehyde 3-phosphate reductase
MTNRQIPNTDLKVSPICLGTMTLGSPVGEKEGIELIRGALERGVNFIDTANMYEGYARYIGSSGGVAEQIIGKALAGRRSQAVLATKVGMKVGDEPEDEYTSAPAIRTQLDRSLQRLDTEYVDIYYLHRPDPSTPLVETLGALDEAIKQGKVRYYGISNYSAEQMAELLAVADANGLPRPVIHQPPLSLLNQDVCADLLGLCEKENIAVAPYQVIQGGLLTGKYQRGQGIPADSRKAEKDGWVWELKDELFDKLEAIEANASNAGLSMTQYAIRWALEQPAVVSAVMGVKRLPQLDEAIAAAK